MGGWGGRKISDGGRLEMGEGFGKAGLLHVVAELRVEAGLVFVMPCGEGFGNFTQGVEMAGRIAIAPIVIGDDRLAALEQIDERLVHVYDSSMIR